MLKYHSSALAPLPASYAKRHHVANPEPGPGSPPPTTAIQSELAALRDEVSRLRQEQQAGGSSSGGAAVAPPAPRGEKSTYSPVVMSPQSAQQDELAALREEVMRLRQEQAHGHHLLDDSEAPPEYEAEAHR